MENQFFIDPIKKEMEVNAPLRDRRIFLNEEIDRESIFKVMYWLDRFQDMDKKSGKKQPIELVLDSYGGSATITLAICSKLKSMIKNGYEITTRVNSMAYSGGFWILICGSKRVALENSHILIHPISGGMIGGHKDMEEELEEVNKIWVRLKKIILENTKIKEEKLDQIKKDKFDWFLYGDEAIELGIVDEIL